MLDEGWIDRNDQEKGIIKRPSIKIFCDAMDFKDREK